MAKNNNNKSYGWWYYVWMCCWVFGRGIWDGALTGFERVVCCYRHRRRAVMPDSLAGKTVVVTGADGGIGRATVKACARRGARVIMACRDVEHGRKIVNKLKLNQEHVHLVQLELGSLQSVRNCAAEIADLCEEINVLFNTAGVMMCPKWSTADGLEHQFGVNFVGHFLLTLLLLPRIRGRIVNLSSITFAMGRPCFDDLNLDQRYNSLGSYSRSKLAILWITQVMARKLKERGSNVTVYAIHPGLVNTKIVRHLPWILWVLAKSIGLPFAIWPEMGAQTSLHCGFSEEAREESGLYYENCRPLSKLPKHAMDQESAERMWELAFKLCGLDEKDFGF